MDGSDPSTEKIAETTGRIGMSQQGLMNLADAEMEVYIRDTGIDDETDEPQTELIIKSELPARRSETRLTLPTETLQQAFCDD